MSYLRYTLFKEAATTNNNRKARLVPPPSATTRWDEQVPRKVTHLDLSGNIFDETLGPIQVPSHVKWVDVSRTNYAHHMIDLPDTIETLICTHSNLPTCPAFPSELKRLDLSMSILEQLPDLPDTLEVLVLSKCYSLTSLPELPVTLRVLDVRECDRLVSLPEIPDSLVELWTEGAVKLPRIYEGEYWEVANNCRKQQEETSRLRQQKRIRDLRLEIVAAAYHPRRVERWLDERGWDILEEMLG